MADGFGKDCGGSELHLSTCYDRTLQDRLLCIDEDIVKRDLYVNLERENELESFRTACARPTSKRNTTSKLRQHGSGVDSRTPSGWTDGKPARQGHMKLAPGKDNKETRHWREFSVWKTKSDIHVPFRHYSDSKKYIEQYRKEYTYSNGGKLYSGFRNLYSDTVVTSRPQQILSDLSQSGPEMHHNNKGLKGRTKSEFNLLEFTLRRYRMNSVLNSIRNSSTDLTQADQGDRNGQCSQRKSDSRATHQSVDTSDPDSPNTSPAVLTDYSQLTKHSTSCSNVPSLAGAKMKHTPRNGFAVDNRTKKPARYPRMLIPSHNMRTVDLLSHMAMTDREEMWFDANGRAYVSLATRYDPIRK